MTYLEYFFVFLGFFTSVISFFGLINLQKRIESIEKFIKICSEDLK